MMKRIVVILLLAAGTFLITMAIMTQSQDNSAPKQSGDTLTGYATNKVIPKTIKAEVLKALSFYPELKDTKITFRFKEGVKKSVMQAQPKFTTIFRSRDKRAYYVNISESFQLDDTILEMNEVPPNVLVGWVGHELGHIMDYRRRGALDLIKFGIGYTLSKRFIIGAEKTADIYAIEHGLADRIIDTKNFILNHSDMPQVYKNKIKDLYMSPEEVMMLVDSTGTILPDVHPH